jgi:hypothetical protein
VENEGEAEGVACCEEVGESVDVACYVEGWLREEGGEEGLEGCGYDEGRGWWWRWVEESGFGI